MDLHRLSIQAARTRDKAFEFLASLAGFSFHWNHVCGLIPKWIQASVSVSLRRVMRVARASTSAAVIFRLWCRFAGGVRSVDLGVVIRFVAVLVVVVAPLVSLGGRHYSASRRLAASS
jgi:hypothetical protein